MANTDDPALLASELRLALGQLVRRLRVEHRLSLSHAAVLARLEREGTHSIGSLAVSERIRPQSMAQTVRDMEADGLIERRADPNDGRRSLVETTEEGRRALGEDRLRREGWLTEAIANELTVDERAGLMQAIGLLRRLGELDPPSP
jgi:DNA-binding MarR family transcriptional regulator